MNPLADAWIAVLLNSKGWLQPFHSENIGGFLSWGRPLIIFLGDRSLLWEFGGFPLWVLSCNLTLDVSWILWTEPIIWLLICLPVGNLIFPLRVILALTPYWNDAVISRLWNHKVASDANGITLIITRTFLMRFVQLTIVTLLLYRSCSVDLNSLFCFLINSAGFISVFNRD